ncbi:hypothetical protein [Actimicrobium sp. CCI2.3]|uniref:hypothetical protein n=1 Tax=Actimicrobium sp. CCI2.3 TaxID=3048616 RepID=UPI002AB4DBE9|nr:hypothetical protein [Actimicrobium sp. CCI2.3]MDY7576013.1 hypothetical protein [Actimicrobium sp. CCI2.3]MEB0023326.1 hypothetical protein [Actimicrobium sp. CCI2.3]
MSAQLMFKPNGDGYDVSPAGVILIIAGMVYGEDRATMSRAGIQKFTRLIDDVLSAARTNGYPHEDILRTLLARNESGPRMVEMMQAACDAAGSATMDTVIGRMRQ